MENLASDIIAIATFISHNYGTCLQAKALKIAVEKLGYRTEILSFREKSKVDKKKNKLINLFHLFISTSPLKIYYIYKVRPLWNLSEIKFTQFINDHLRPQYVSSDESMDFSSKYKKAITGSDMVWSPEFFEFREGYFLRWISEERRIAYAPSFGAGRVDENNRFEYQKYIEGIKYLSCREQSGCSLIKELTKRDAKLVCDPTLLFDEEEWKKMFKIGTTDDKYVLVNCFKGLNTCDTKQLRKVVREKGLKIRYLTPGVEETLNEVIYGFDGYGPLEFLRLYANSTFNIVNGYHGLLFSLIFNKPFIVLHRYGGDHWGIHEQRMEDILSFLHIKGRYLNSLKELNENHLTLDYSDITPIIEDLRKTSWEYLMDSLKK